MMKEYTLTSRSPEETRGIAEKLGKFLDGGEVLLLNGAPGAGKTTFTQGLARGLGITQTVNSPTFTIVKEYEGRLPLYHVDAYRLEDETEELGLEEYFEGEGVTVVEWAERIAVQLPAEFLEIHILPKGERERLLTFKPCGARYEQLLKEVLA